MSAERPRCGLSWCRAPHGPGSTTGHATVIGTWRSGSRMVELVAGQALGCEPVVRLSWGEHASPRARVRDLTPELAADLGEVIGMLSVRDYQEFAAALRRAGRALDS